MKQKCESYFDEIKHETVEVNDTIATCQVHIAKFTFNKNVLSYTLNFM